MLANHASLPGWQGYKIHVPRPIVQRILLHKWCVMLITTFINLWVYILQHICSHWKIEYFVTPINTGPLKHPITPTQLKDTISTSQLKHPKPQNPLKYPKPHSPLIALNQTSPLNYIKLRGYHILQDIFLCLVSTILGTVW